MLERQIVTSDTHWERIAGFAQAVQYNDRILISGTRATDDDGLIVGVGDPYAQTVFVIRHIENVLQQYNATLSDIVRTRIYLTKPDHLQAIARAHEQFFGDIRPASTMVVVQELRGQGCLVEIEAEADISARMGTSSDGATDTDSTQR